MKKSSYLHAKPKATATELNGLLTSETKTQINIPKHHLLELTALQDLTQSDPRALLPPLQLHRAVQHECEAQPLRILSLQWSVHALVSTRDTGIEGLSHRRRCPSPICLQQKAPRGARPSPHPAAPRPRRRRPRPLPAPARDHQPPKTVRPQNAGKPRQRAEGRERSDLAEIREASLNGGRRRRGLRGHRKQTEGSLSTEAPDASHGGRDESAGGVAGERGLRRARV